MCNKKNYNILSEILFSAAYILFRLIKICTIRNYSNRENIIVISLHHIGDTVFTIPAIKKLNRIYQGKMTIVCFEHSRVIYELVFHDIRFMVVPKPIGYLKSRIPSIELRKQIKSLQAKSIYDITGTVFTSLLVAGQNTEQIVGSPGKIFWGAYSHVSKRRSKPHLTDMYLDMVPITGHGGTEDNDKVYPVVLKKNENVLIFPFGGWEAKEWEILNYINLAKLLSNTRKCSIITQKDQINSDLKESMRAMNIPLIETNSLGELVEHIRKCFLFISNDTGPLYIASLLGKPTFSIYGPTNPVYSIPFGRQHRFIKKTLPCSPIGDAQYCYTDAGRTGCSSFECMKILTLKEVFESVNHFINELENDKCL